VVMQIFWEEEKGDVAVLGGKSIVFGETVNAELERLEEFLGVAKRNLSDFGYIE
jgi:hypothetical protein